MVQENLFRGENGLIVQEDTIEGLLGGVVPVQPVERRDSYEMFARKPLTILVGDGNRIVVTFGAITGEELTHLFHFAAPSKELGINYERIRREWCELFSKDGNVHRLQAHRGISGWNEYEPYRDVLFNAICATGENTDAQRLIPVISLKLDEEGQVVWDFEPLSMEMMEALRQHVDVHASDVILPILGPLLAAAYSPEITRNWAGSYGKRNYRRPVETFGKGSRDMGSTEVLPLSLGEASTLLSSPLIQALVNYVGLHHE